MSVSNRSQVILPAATKWKDECLLEGKSIFDGGAIWTEANFAALDRYFVQNLDYGSGDILRGDDLRRRARSQLEYLRLRLPRHPSLLQRSCD